MSALLDTLQVQSFADFVCPLSRFYKFFYLQESVTKFYKYFVTKDEKPIKHIRRGNSLLIFQLTFLRYSEHLALTVPILLGSQKQPATGGD
jgi:hypothetical protein